MRSPCYNCQKRNQLCHMGCEEYTEYRKVVDKVNLIKQKENNSIGYTIDNIIKFKKARNLPQYR